MIRNAMLLGLLVIGVAAARQLISAPEKSHAGEEQKSCCSKDGKTTLASQPKDEKKEPKVKIIPGTGIITGKVSLKGDAPKFDTKIEVPGNHNDKAACTKHVKDQRLILGKEKQLKNVVVFIEDHAYRGKRRPKPRKVVLDNKNCMFDPHVIATTVGSKIDLTNADAFIHNTRGLLATDGINVAVPPKGKVGPKTMRKPGWGIMKCDFHAWMMAHVHIFSHEMFAVTKADGTFTIYNVPPGKYKLKYWHEVLEDTEKEITVEADKKVSADNTLEAYKD